jgi:hypothetical protein
MKIVAICSMSEVQCLIDVHEPDAIISLLDTGGGSLSVSASAPT